MKSQKEKIKELEARNEHLRNECQRLNNELNEFVEKSQSLEIQLENLSTQSRNQLAEKDVSKRLRYWF